MYTEKILVPGESISFSHQELPALVLLSCNIPDNYQIFTMLDEVAKVLEEENVEMKLYTHTCRETGHFTDIPFSPWFLLQKYSF